MGLLDDTSAPLTGGSPAPDDTAQQAPDATPPATGTPDIKGAVAFAAKQYGVDPNIMAGMLMKESMLHPDVISGKRVSTAGAVGIAQFMPDTAKRFGIDATDPIQSIFGMAAYLRSNLDKFGGNYEKAIAGYNWGENRDALKSDDWRSSAPDETKDYVGFVTQFAHALGSNTQAPSVSSPDPIGGGRGKINPGMDDQIAHDLRTGAGAIPGEGTQADTDAKNVANFRQQVATPPASLGDKIEGGIDAAINVGTGLTTGMVGQAGGFLGGAAGALATKLRGGVQPDQGMEQATQEGGEKVTYAPRFDKGREYAEDIGGAMNEAMPVFGHSIEIGGMHQAAAPIKTAAADAARRAGVPLKVTTPLSAAEVASVGGNAAANADAAGVAGAAPEATPAAVQPGAAAYDKNASAVDQMEAVRPSAPAVPDPATRLENATNVDDIVSAASDMAQHPQAPLADRMTDLGRQINEWSQSQRAAGDIGKITEDAATTADGITAPLEQSIQTLGQQIEGARAGKLAEATAGEQSITAGEVDKPLPTLDDAPHEPNERALPASLAADRSGPEIPPGGDQAGGLLASVRPESALPAGPDAVSLGADGRGLGELGAQHADGAAGRPDDAAGVAGAGERRPVADRPGSDRTGAADGALGESDGRTNSTTAGGAGGVPVLREDAGPVSQERASVAPEPRVAGEQVAGGYTAVGGERQSLLDRLTNGVNAKLVAAGRAPLRLTAVETPRNVAGARVAENFVQKVFGKSIIWVKSESARRLFNGAQFDAIPNHFFIDVETEHPVLAVVGHEMLHVMRRDAPRVYDWLTDRTRGFISGNSEYKASLDAKRAKQGLGPLSEDTGIEEQHADVNGDLWMEPSYIDSLAKEQPEGFRKVSAAVIKFLNDTIAKVGRLNPFGSAKYVTDLERVKGLYAKAFRDYAEIYRTEGSLGAPDEASSDAKFSINDDENFKKWFGDSKIVDAAGKPLTMYHGTNADFNSFDRGRSDIGATFVTPDAHFAGGIAEGKAQEAGGEEIGSNLMPLHVRAERPFDYDDSTQRKAVVDKVFADNETYRQGDGQEALRLDGKNTLYTRSVLDSALGEPQEAGNWEVIERPEVQSAIRAIGHDGFYVNEGGVKNLGVYDPNQVKSATGNNGAFSRSSNDVRFSAPESGSADKALPVTDGNGVAKLRSILSTPGRAIADVYAKVRDGLLFNVSPMSLGSDFARKTAKEWANSDRVARYQWQQFDKILKTKFTTEQLERMWNAADEENDIRGGTLKPVEGEAKGLSSLPDDQRAAVEKLSQYGEELLARARDLGMFKGEGVPFWAPRMAALIGDNGEIAAHGTSVGKDVTTTANSLKQRKYLTTEETEAAAKAKLGDQAEIVRNIRTMPLAMARLERALAGRELVNAIKDYGDHLGIETVNDKGGDGYFTIDKPAYKTWGPKFVTDPESGKTVAAIDQFGNPVMVQSQLHISNEFRGPLKAISYEKPGIIYGSLMGLKSKAMSVLMFSPLLHNAVEFGRALPVAPLKVATFAIYFEGNRVRKNPAIMRQAVQDGLVPIGSHGGRQDITGITEDPQIRPGQSLTSKAIGGAVGLVHDGAGEAVKRGIDKAGEFYHQTLLWDRVGDLQAGLYSHLKQQQISKGMAPDVAGKLAAHWANRYAGALPNESMSNGARMIANMTLFSRSFSLGNLGAIKDMITGLPKDVQSQILMSTGDINIALSKIDKLKGVAATVPGLGGLAKTKTQSAIVSGRRKAITAFLMDAALMYVGNDVLQDTLDKLRRDKSWGQIGQGYLDRLHALSTKASNDPWAIATSPLASFESLLATSTNEPGKENRIHYGNQGDGTAQYVRLPTGKVGEDFVNWIRSPVKTFKAKMSTFAKPITEVLANDNGIGQRVYDPDASASVMKNVGRIIKLIAEAQVPMDTINGAVNIAQGKANDTDVAKVVGPIAGFTFSKGAPGGPAVGELYAADRKYIGDKQDIMPEVAQDIKDGNRDKAIERMTAIGMSAPEMKQVLKHLENPESRLTGAGLKNFNRRASDDDKAKMETIRGQ